MSYDLSDEEKRGVLGAPDDKQYDYFLNKAADQGEVWALELNGEYGTIADSETDKPVMAVWPHPGFAEDDRTDGWERHTPAPIPIHRFLEHLRVIQEDDMSIAVLHQPSGDYLQIPAGALADALLAALDEVQ